MIGRLTRSSLAAASLLLVTGAARSDFLRLEAEVVPNDLDLVVCDLYAVFGDPDDQLLAVFADPEQPILIEVIDGVFNQHVLGLDTEPGCELIGVFPELAFDTFITIGRPCRTMAEASTSLSVGGTWPGFGPDALDCDECAWFSNPAEAVTLAGEDGRVLLGRLATPDGRGFRGSMQIDFASDGRSQDALGLFLHLTCADATGDDEVSVDDLVKVIVCWGTDDPDADLDGNGVVDVNDLVAVISAIWGPCS